MSADATEVAFGLWVRQERRARKMSQTELGSLTGLDASAISRIESGERRVCLREAVAICGVFDTTAGDWLDGLERRARRARRPLLSAACTVGGAA